MSLSLHAPRPIQAILFDLDGTLLDSNMDVFRQISHAPEQCLMVGDEAMDMAAATIGMATFLTPGASTRLDGATPEPTYRGTLTDLVALLER